MCDERLSACVLAFSLSVSVHAQVVSDVTVSLTPPNCMSDYTAYLVAGDEIDGAIPILGTDCIRNTNPRGKSFSARRPVSLRFFSPKEGVIARTECHEVNVERETLTATLDLTCCTEKGSTVVVEQIDPDMPAGYLRIIDAREGAASDRSKSVPCTEIGSLKRGAGEVQQVLLAEQVRLQFNVQKPDAKKFGLLLHRGMRKTLSFDDVVHEITAQGAKGIDGSAPHLSPNAIEVFTRNLRNTKFKELKVGWR